MSGRRSTGSFARSKTMRLRPRTLEEFRRDRCRDTDLQDSRDWPRWPCWRVEGAWRDAGDDEGGALHDALKAAFALGAGDPAHGPRLKIEDRDIALFTDLDDSPMWRGR